jgi:hypothetical protein
MFRIQPNRRKAMLAAAVVGLVATLLAAAPSVAGATPSRSLAAGDPTGAGTSQDPNGRHDNPDGEKPAPYQCRLYTQILPDEQRYRATNNQPYIYTDAVFGGSWFDVKCGNLTFMVPPGKEALVDLNAVAELDCGHFDSPVPVGWCGARFLINGLPLPDPDNTGLEDSYAWDASNAGGFDYSSHAFAQVYKADCTAPTTANGCFYRVQLQSRLEVGTRSIWIDDLTMSVDVNLGPVTVVP